MIGNTVVRPFDASLADAEGILAVERATFDESPYSGEQVRAMLTSGPQRAWVAAGEGRVVGFVIAFATQGLRGLSWEIDLLAVLPAWRGRRLATRLIREAAAFGAGVTQKARAFVATDNYVSMRAFIRAGFQAEPELYESLAFRPQEQVPQPWATSGVTVREATGIVEVTNWLPENTALAAPVGSVARQEQGRFHWTLLLAEQAGQPAGHVELIEVQTLLYRGVWIESLVASGRTARETLVREAVKQARAVGLDEVGAMTPKSNRRLQGMLLASGFQSLGDYHWLTAEL